MKLMRNFAIVAIISIVLVNFTGCGDNSTAPPGNGNNYESPPLPPEDLSALPISRHEIELTWKDRSDNEEGFEIFESIDNDSSYEKIFTLGVNKTTHKLDGKRVDSLYYYYKVRSYNKYGNSAYTNVAMVSGSALYGEVDVGDSPVTCIDYDPTGRYILIGCGDFKVRRYYSARLELAQTLEMHNSLIKSVAYSPDSLRFASGDNNGEIRIWNVALGRVEYVFTTNSVGGGKADKLEFSSDSRYLAAGSEYVNIWELETGELYDRISIDDSMDVDCYAWHPEGRYIVAAGDNKIQIWEIGNSNTPIYSFDIPIATSLDPSHLVVSPDGKYIIGAESSVIIIWEIKNLGGSISIEYVTKIDENNGGHQRSVYGIDFSYNGLYFATCSNDNTIKAWDANTFTLLSTIDAHEPAVYGVAFSPDGMHMASAGADTKVKVWLTFF